MATLLSLMPPVVLNNNRSSELLCRLNALETLLRTKMDLVGGGAQRGVEAGKRQEWHATARSRWWSRQAVR